MRLESGWLVGCLISIGIGVIYCTFLLFFRIDAHASFQLSTLLFCNIHHINSSSRTHPSLLSRPLPKLPPCNREPLLPIPEIPKDIHIPASTSTFDSKTTTSASDGLSNGAKAGIDIGVGVGSLLIIANVVSCIVFRRQRWKLLPADPGPVVHTG